MKKGLVLVLLLWLGGCASLGVKPGCPTENLKRVSYFEEGQKLAGFRFTATARGYAVGGILQIKALGLEEYEITAFSNAGGFKLLSARVTPQKTDFSYVLPMVDKPLVRGKVDTLLRLLLFPPTETEKCRADRNGQILITAQGSYRYALGAVYPSSLTQKKLWGSVRLSYGQYAPYEQGEIPHYLFYEDGGVEGELVLVSLKK